MKNKARIITTDGVINATDVAWFKFKSPKWLGKYQFFTHRKLGVNNEPTPLFTVSEKTSGRTIPNYVGALTRSEAKKYAQEKFIRVGQEAVDKAIKTTAIPL